MLEKLQGLKNVEIRENENGKMQQTDANNFTNEVRNILYQQLKAVYDQTYLTKEGIYLAVEHEDWGMIPYAISVKRHTKDLIMTVEDLETLEEEYLEEIETKRAKAEAKAKETARKRAEAEAKREKAKK